MLRFCLGNLIGLCLLIPVFAHATSRLYDADAVITMHNGNPCFSYPQDEEVRKRLYSFDYLGVSKQSGGVVWQISIAVDDSKKLREPDSPETCIEYGVPVSGSKEKQPALPLLPDTPYKVLISTSVKPLAGIRYERRFLTCFCISSNNKGEPVIVEADYDDGWYCRKPGEKKSRGFWDWLFGK